MNDITPETRIMIERSIKNMKKRTVGKSFNAADFQNLLDNQRKSTSKKSRKQPKS